MLRTNLAPAPIVTVTPSDRAPIITTTQTPSTTVVAPVVAIPATTTTTVTTTVVEPGLPLAGAPLVNPVGKFQTNISCQQHTELIAF